MLLLVRWVKRPFVLYALLCLACYAGALGIGFLSDDFLMVSALGEGRSMSSWGAEHGGFFRPVTVASMWLDARLLGARPLLMHVENVLLHATCAWLVHQLAARVFAGFAKVHPLAAPLAGALFALHPSHAEAVVWISGRGDLLATMFGVGGLTLALDYLRRGGAWRCLLVGVAWLAAVLSKESALALPGSFLALGLAAAPRVPWRRVGAVLTTGALVLCLWLALRVAVLGAVITSVESSNRLEVTAGKWIGALKRQLLRSVFPAVAPGDGASLVASILVGSVVLAAVALFARGLVRGSDRLRANAWLPGVLAAYLLSLVPVFASRVDLDGGEGERFVYLPTALAALGMAGVVACHNWRIGRVVACAWLLAYAVLTPLSVTRWRCAGRFAEEVVQSLVGQARGPKALVLNVPDSVEGAYVFRNGLREAVALERNDLDVRIFVTFRAERNGAGARATPLAAHADAWEVLATRPWPYQACRAPELVFNPSGSGEQRHQTLPLAGFADIFAFQDGRLVRVGPQQRQ